MKVKSINPITLLCISVFAFCSIFCIICKILNPFFVSGESMYPTYNDGQVVFTTPFDNISSLSCGDVLIIKEAGKYMIKRVEGLPGQELYISDEGVLYRNNEPVDDPYNIKTESSGLLSEKYMIPKDTVFVLGDNRNNSNDSRFYGPISVDNIISIVKN